MFKLALRIKEMVTVEKQGGFCRAEKSKDETLKDYKRALYLLKVQGLIHSKPQDLPEVSAPL